MSNNNAVYFVKNKNCWIKEQKRFIKRNAPRATHLKKMYTTQNKREELSFVIPGLKHVFDSRKGFVFNTLWFLVISCSSCICFYQIYNRLQLFISNPVDSRVTVTQNESVKFPSLTICSPEDRYFSLIHLQKMKSAIQKIPVCNVTIFDLMPELNISTIWTNMNTFGLINSPSIIGKLKHENHEYLSTLKTNWRLTYFGNCTTYSISNLIAFRGEDFKIHLPMLPLLDYSCGLWFMSAMYIFHHDDEDITYRIVAENSYLVVNRVMTWGIEAKRFKVINRRYSPCDKISVVSQCERRCLENIFKKRFTCRLPFMDFDDIPLCTNSTHARKVYTETYNIVLGIVYSKNCSCPDRCEKILYSKNLVFSSPLHVSLLEYFFDSNVVVDIQEYYSYTLVPFICDVGGNLGLFLGLCIPAILDILQSIIGYLITRVTRACTFN